MDGLAGWDEETYMPEAAAPLRGEAHGYISVLMKKQFLDSEFVRLVESVDMTECSLYERAIVQSISREILQYTALPDLRLQERSEAKTNGTYAWKKARETDNFSLFSPYLERIILLLRQKAELIWHSNNPYDTLIDDYERGLTTSTIDAFYAQLKEPLLDIMSRVRPEFHTDSPINSLPYNADALRTLTHKVLDHIWFDTNTTRLDMTTHPFCSGFHRNDVRITTRLEDKWNETIFSSLHEYGHALYQLQYDPALEKTPLAILHSMTIHESQSRFWENIVGRSRPFLDLMGMDFSTLWDEFASYSSDDYYYAINEITPWFIRTQADEITYHIHVMIRYELERALIDGSLSVENLPAARNQKYTDYLGITPPNNTLGVLQDVHRAFWLFGYFPTYSMGTALSAQRAEAMQKDLWSIESLSITSEGVTAIRAWLEKHVHHYGSTYSVRELLDLHSLQLSPDALLRYLEQKYT
jgi:carboxypeptidase Taq